MERTRLLELAGIPFMESDAEHTADAKFYENYVDQLRAAFDELTEFELGDDDMPGALIDNTVIRKELKETLAKFVKLHDALRVGE